MPLDDIADPFTEAGLRARARGGLLAAPSDAIFDPRTRPGAGAQRLGPQPGVQGRPRRHGAAAAGRRAGPDRAARDPHRAADPALARHAEPPRPDLVSRRQGRDGRRRPPSTARCARRTRRSACDAEFVEPLGYLDSYRTGTGFQISPVVAFVRPGFDRRARSARGARGVRGAAGLPDGRGQPPEGTRASGAAASAPSMPCPTRAAISGARPPACSRTCTRGCFSDDPRRHREHPAVPAADRHVRRLRAADAAQRHRRRRVVNDAPLVWLFVAGALLVGRHARSTTRPITPGGTPGQTYTPPRMKDGQIEPGQLK